MGFLMIIRKSALRDKMPIREIAVPLLDPFMHREAFDNGPDEPGLFDGALAVHDGFTRPDLS